MNIRLVNKTILLSKEGYDPFIDYLKGVSILFVILAHCLPLQEYILFSLWGAQAVPLFLLVQVFHSYKKSVGCISVSYDLKKLFHRIFKPFLLLVVIQLLLLIFIQQKNPIVTIKNAILSGGIGPGSYYVWIYVQFFFLLPIVGIVNQRIRGGYLLLIFTMLCIALEMLCTYIHIPAGLYRLLAIRYVYLICLGYIWTISGIEINKRTILLSFISILFILMFTYTSINLEPLFFNNDWKICHWVCYFYVAYLFVYLLHKIYQWSSRYLNSLFCLMGKCSYEIFLLQMFVFTFFPSAADMAFIGNSYVIVLIRIVLTTSLSILPVLFYNCYLKKYKYRMQ